MKGTQYVLDEVLYFASLLLNQVCVCHVFINTRDSSDTF